MMATTCDARSMVRSRGFAVALSALLLGACGDSSQSAAQDDASSFDDSTSDVVTTDSSTLDGGGSPDASDATPSGDLVKFNPGQWLRIVPGHPEGVWGCDLRDPTVLANVMSFIDSIAGKGFQGIYLEVGFSTLEKTRGTYDFTAVDAILAKLSSHGMRLGIGVVTNIPFLNESAFPQYMIDDPATYFASRTPSGRYDVVLRWWTKAARDRLIAVYQAIGAHYDENPKFEMVGLTGELSFDAYVFDAPGADPTYDYASVRDGWKALAEAWHAAAPHTMGFQWYNDTKDDTIETHQEYYAIAAKNHVMWGNPNFVKYAADLATIAAVGMGYDGKLPPSSGFLDYTKIMPMAAPGSDANDFYTVSPHGDSSGNPYGPPYQTLDEQWAGKAGPHTGITDVPHGAGSGVHGSFSWALPSPLTIPFMNVSHYLWLVNDGQGGDASNSWVGAEPSFIMSKIGKEPAYTVPTCFGGKYVTGG